MKRVVLIIDVVAALLFVALAIAGYCQGNEIRMFGNLILAVLYLLKLDLDGRDDTEIH